VFAFCADGSAGLAVVDVSTPASPTEVASVPLPLGAFAFGVAVSGRYVYVASGESGLRVMDIDDLASPVDVGYFETPTSRAK